MHPRRFRQPTLLIVGCGDIGLRVARMLKARWRMFALTSSMSRCPLLRDAGIVPLVGDLDDAGSLQRIGALADAVLHLAPPQGQGEIDLRTRHLLQALGKAGRARTIVYGSTTGVYGDCGGARFDETRTARPQTARARRRVDAEAQLRGHGRSFSVRASVLRIPGIYALDREGGDPRERVSKKTPVLAAGDDVFTNHIHADDLARACVAALWRGAPQRAYHACDDTELKMGDYFDLVADRAGLPRPPRIARADVASVLSPMTLSFMSESRRLINTRLKRELKLRLLFATVDDGLAQTP